MAKGCPAICVADQIYEKKLFVAYVWRHLIGRALAEPSLCCGVNRRSNGRAMVACDRKNFAVMLSAS
jgi:hypothetical protein